VDWLPSRNKKSNQNAKKQTGIPQMIDADKSGRTIVSTPVLFLSAIRVPTLNHTATKD
jgi:hypothetical protein